LLLNLMRFVDVELSLKGQFASKRTE
jgi:hypothetical protein